MIIQTAAITCLLNTFANLYTGSILRGGEKIGYLFALIVNILTKIQIVIIFTLITQQLIEFKSNRFKRQFVAVNA